MACGPYSRLLAVAADVREWAPSPIGAGFNDPGLAVSSTVAAAAVEDDEWLHAINFEGAVHGVRLRTDPQGRGRR